MGFKLSNYSTTYTSITWMQIAIDGQRIGYDGVSISEFTSSVQPAIAAGSKIDCAGALFSFSTIETISTVDPVSSLSVADGVVYICLLPSSSQISAAFTATAPVWRTDYNGWYLNSTSEKRCLPFSMTKNSTEYTNKKSLVFSNNSNVTVTNAGKINMVDLNVSSGFITGFEMIKTVTGNLAAGSPTDVSHPTGFTGSNSMVISCYAFYDSSLYIYPGYDSVSGLYFNVYTFSTYIRMTYPAGLNGSPYKVMLARLS